MGAWVSALWGAAAASPRTQSARCRASPHFRLRHQHRRGSSAPVRGVERLATGLIREALVSTAAALAAPASEAVFCHPEAPSEGWAPGAAPLPRRCRVAVGPPQLPEAAPSRRPDALAAHHWVEADEGDL